MSNCLSIAVFFLGCFSLYAQPDSLAPVMSVMDTNNIKLTTMANGDMGWNYTNMTTRAPKFEDTGFLYASGLWIASKDTTNGLYLAANSYNNTGGMDFWAGPIADYYDTDYDTTYNRSWTIGMEEIDYHRAHYFEDSYEMPEVIAHWPGNGSISNGESDQLAPYYDDNSNGIYEPESGDFPLIRGDKAVFVIYNDDRNVHTNTGGIKVGAEVHMMLYAYNSEDTAIYNAVFVHYEVFNRGDNDFNEMYAAVWNDWDLGGNYDDIIACDKDRNVSFVYNQFNFDKSIFGTDSILVSQGFGNNPPAAGLISLNEDIYTHTYWQNNSNAMSGNLQEAKHYINHLNGYWTDGSPIPSNDGSLLFNDISVEDTLDLDLVHNWGERDRRSLHNVLIPSFLSGESFCLDFAYVFAENTNYSAKKNAVLLMDYVDDIQVFYDAHFANCTDHSADFDNLSTEEFVEELEVDLLKGAGSNVWVLSGRGNMPKAYTVHLVNTVGQELYQTYWDTESDLEMKMDSFAKGVYFIRIRSGNESRTMSFIKE